MLNPGRPLAQHAPHKKPAGAKTVPAKKPAAAPKAAPAAAVTPAPNAALIAAGRKVYDANGCAGCHAIAGKGGNTAPDLTHTGQSSLHTIEWLSIQLTTPKAHNPGSTMPPYAESIKGANLTAITTFLASLKEEAVPVKIIHASEPSNPAAVAKLQKLGANIGVIAQNDDHLDVNLHMAGAAITDTTVAPVASLRSASHLDLGQTGITDAGLAYVKMLTGLTELHLEGTKISDAGLANLAGLKELTYLNLYNTGISDAGLAHLTGLKKLHRLYLWQTKVTDAGVAKLKQALPQLEVVQGWAAPAAK